MFTRDCNYRELLEIIVFWIDRRLREMVTYVRWSHIEVRLSSFKCTGHLNEGDLETLHLNAGVGLSRCIYHMNCFSGKVRCADKCSYISNFALIWKLMV